MMKARFIVSLILVIVLVVGIGVAVGKTIAVKPAIAQSGVSAGASPVLVIENSHVMKLSQSAVLMVMGAGFPPNEEVRVVISQKDGSLSDIGDQLDPKEITANEFGVWGAKLTTGRFAHSALASTEIYVLYATDADYNILAATPFGYYDAKAPYSDWPSWAQAVVPDPGTSK